MLKNIRKYGKSPFDIAVIHGGPGAPGGMAPVARELCRKWGVLEPLQTAPSLEGQVRELKDVLEEYVDLPVTLIGSSWGAMLSFIFSARYPALTRKLILVGSGAFEGKYAADILETRFSRLSEAEREQAYFLMKAMDEPEPAAQDKSTLLAKLGHLFTKADAYNPLTLDTEVLECQYDLHTCVWQEARELRKSGKLIELGKRIHCPVVAIHGDYDPHLPAGVENPLSLVVKEFRFILLKNCGHLPWIEKEAKDTFYRILKEELP